MGNAGAEIRSNQPRTSRFPSASTFAESQRRANVTSMPLLCSLRAAAYDLGRPRPRVAMMFRWISFVPL